MLYFQKMFWNINDVNIRFLRVNVNINVNINIKLCLDYRSKVHSC